jgi:HEAT repeat protein
MLNKKRQELLIQNLRSISSEVRIRSVEQLENFPVMPAEEKIQHIEVALNDTDEKVRIAALAAITRLKGGETPPASVSSAPFTLPPIPTTDPTPATLIAPSVPPVIPSALGTPSVPPVIPSALGTPSVPPVIPSALGTPSVPPLIQPDFPSPQIPPAIPTQAEPEFVESANPFLVNDDCESLFNEPLDPSLPDIKKINDVIFLLDYIKKLQTGRPSGYLQHLVALVVFPIEEVALTALQALINVKDNRVVPHILKLMSDNSQSSQRRFLMLKIILDSQVPLNSELLEQILLNEKDVIVKSGLVKAYARSVGEKGLNTLAKCLKDEDPRVRANTVEVIEEQKIRGCERNIATLLSDTENRVKVNAAKYLVKNGFKQAFETLKAMLVSQEVWLRDSVIFALGEIGDQASLTLLKAALKDPNQGIRLSVLKALSNINNSTARQVLNAACKDPDPVVAQVAYSLCEKLKDVPIKSENKYPDNFINPASPVPSAPSVLPSAPTVPSPKPSVLPSAPTVPSPMPSVLPSAPTFPSINPTSPSIPRAPIPQNLVSDAPNTLNTVVSNVEQPNNELSGFEKPRSAEIFKRLCSNDLSEMNSAVRDIAFVMGKDQMILIKKALTIGDEGIKIAAIRILSRKRTPEARDLLVKYVSDPNEIIRSLVEKTLSLG